MPNNLPDTSPGEKAVRMLANKSGMDRLADLAHHAKALKDIIKAALRGGWHAAALPRR